MKYMMITAAVVVLSACGNGADNGNFIRSVKTVKPALADTVTVRTFPGVVREAQKVNVGFKTPGQLSHIFVNVGDYVNEGDLVARLDDKDYKLQLSATQIQYNQLTVEVNRLEELHRRNSIAGNDYEKAVAGLQALGVLLQSHKNTVEYTVLRAPLSGYVQSVNYKASEMVDAGMTVVSLIDLSSVSVETDIPLSMFLQREKFGEMWCTTNTFPDTKFSLKSVGINRKSGGNQLYRMHLVSATHQSAQLVAGMNVEIAITVRNNNPTTISALPMNTVMYDGEQSYVWILLPDSTVSRRNVVIEGIDTDGNLIISAGIMGNEEVISAGAGVIRESEKVRVIDEPAKSNVGGLL
jgi:RND family efflux transporter MFP subunit